jgi:hypothetical protein
MGNDIKMSIKRELKAAKVFDSYFSMKDVDAALKDIRPYSPRTAKERAANKLVNKINGTLLKSDTPSNGVSVVRFLYALVELRFKVVFKMMESEREYYYAQFDDFIKVMLKLDQYPPVLFTQTDVKW